MTLSLPLRIGAVSALVLPLACGSLSDQQKEMLVIHQQESKLYYDVGDMRRAEDQCRRGLAIDDDDFTLKLTLAYVLLQRADRDALLEADQILADLQGFGNSDDYRVHLGRGIALTSLARLSDHDSDEAADYRDDARDHLQRALDIETECTEAAFQLCLVDLEDETHDDFWKHSDQTLTLIQRSLRVKELTLGRVETERQKQLVERDLLLDRNRGRRLLRLRAEMAFKDERYEAALAELGRLEEIGFTRADYFDRAQILAQVGDLERAVDDLETFIELSTEGIDPNVETAVERLYEWRAKLAEARTDGSGA